MMASFLLKSVWRHHELVEKKKSNKKQKQRQTKQLCKKTKQKGVSFNRVINRSNIYMG